MRTWHPGPLTPLCITPPGAPAKQELTPFNRSLLGPCDKASSIAPGPSPSSGNHPAPRLRQGTDLLRASLLICEMGMANSSDSLYRMIIHTGAANYDVPMYPFSLLTLSVQPRFIASRFYSLTCVQL